MVCRMLQRWGLLLFCCCMGFMPSMAQNKKKNTAPVAKTPAQLRLDSLRVVQAIKRDSTAKAREMESERRKLKQEELAAQRAAGRKKTIPPLTQEMSGSYKQHTDGWSLVAQRGFIRNEDPDNPFTTFLWFEFSEKKHPKEVKQQNNSYLIINPGELKPMGYKYGKINNFYALKLGYGRQKPISGKIDKTNVQVSWVYAAALSFGFLKPYYLDVLMPEGNVFIRKTVKYTEETRPYFLDLFNKNSIIGGTNFIRGINELKILPGLAVRSGFNFDYAPSRKTFTGIELGVSAELYTKEATIMAIAPNRSWFVNLYADFHFGKRWE